MMSSACTEHLLRNATKSANFWRAGDPQNYNCENAEFVTSSKFTHLEDLCVQGKAQIKINNLHQWSFLISSIHFIIITKYTKVKNLP